jgi:hypothetical protein
MARFPERWIAHMVTRRLPKDYKLVREGERRDEGIVAAYRRNYYGGVLIKF